MELLLMNKAIVWSQANCQYCETAISVLKARGVEVEVRKLGEGTWTKEDLIKAVPTARSVPQIFVDDVYVGGYHSLVDTLQ